MWVIGEIKKKETSNISIENGEDEDEDLTEQKQQQKQAM